MSDPKRDVVERVDDWLAYHRSAVEEVTLSYGSPERRKRGLSEQKEAEDSIKTIIRDLERERDKALALLDALLQNAWAIRECRVYGMGEMTNESLDALLAVVKRAGALLDREGSEG